MTAIPVNTVTAQDIAELMRLQQELTRIKAAEMLLRTKVYKFYFPNADEGTNTLDMGQGNKIKGIRTINRKIDLPVLQAMAVPNGALHVAGIRADDLVKWTPELKIGAYRELTAEQKAVFDNCLEIKDGAPALTFITPAQGK